MCKHMVLMPVMADSVQKKSCQAAVLRRAWHAVRRSISLNHPLPQHFACCQWQKTPRPPLAYLVYRWILFISVVAIGISSFAFQRQSPNYEGPRRAVSKWKWLIYFTNWGYLMIIVQSTLALAVGLKYNKERNIDLSPQEEEESAQGRRTRTPLLCKAYWLTHTVATDIAFVVTLVYWSLVHDSKLHELNALNLLVHVGNTVVMLTELMVTSHPFRVAHALYSVALGMAYGLFSAIYWAAGGTDRNNEPAIYPSLNWNSPGLAIGFVCLCACVMVLSHALATILANVRVRLASRFFHGSTPTPTPPPSATKRLPF